ncbi:MAG: hypothetical protein FWG29_03420 [Treponema sp.]|nr:hypothetical protein [Treponema sp.]
MKKALITIVLIFILGVHSFAQESKVAFGYGIEMNMNSEYGVGGGAILSFDVNLLQQFAAGINVTMSGDSYDNGVLETAIIGRYYFSSFHKGFFLQGDFGLSIIALRDEKTFYKFLIGAHGGYRLPFGEFFYVEPHVRVGSPFAFGIGVVAGFRR